MSMDATLPGRARAWVARAAIALLLLSTGSTTSEAQVLEGRVLDGHSRQPVADARITLLHPDGSELGDPTSSGEDGTFTLEIPGVGEYYIRVDRSPYTSLVDGIFAFTAVDARLSVEVYLLPQTVEVEGIDVRIQREQARRELRYAGFYERAAVGQGHFIGPTEIERIGSTVNVSDYLRRVPGVNLYQGLVLFKDPGNRLLTGLNGEVLHMCEPNVWVDGTLMPKANDERSLDRSAGGAFETDLRPSDLSQSLDNYVNPEDVLGIEVYRRISTTPLQWVGPGTSCGSILIWTKSGRGL